jgi:nitroreductase
MFAMELYEKSANTGVKIHELISKRWSPRAFSDRAVEREKLLSLMEAARWAPSSFNEQPWRFIIATKDDREEFDRMLGCLNEFNQQWAISAPVLLITVASDTFKKNGKPNEYSFHDVGLAMGNLTTQATAHDMYVHQMAGIKPDKIREVYDIPEGFTPVAAAAIGYAGEIDRIPESMHKAETSERKRKPLDELVFSGSFGTSSGLLVDQSKYQ